MSSGLTTQGKPTRSAITGHRVVDPDGHERRRWEPSLAHPATGEQLVAGGPHRLGRTQSQPERRGGRRRNLSGSVADCEYTVETVARAPDDRRYGFRLVLKSYRDRLVFPGILEDVTPISRQHEVHPHPASRTCERLNLISRGGGNEKHARHLLVRRPSPGPVARLRAGGAAPCAACKVPIPEQPARSSVRLSSTTAR